MRQLLHPLKFWSCLALSIAAPAVSARADELRYRWEPGQKFAFNIVITVEENEKTTTYRGMTQYEVNTATPEQMKVTYRGGLNEQVKTKPSDRGNLPFGPRGFGAFGPRGMGGPPSPFSRPTFAGKVQTTNRFAMTPSGQVLNMEGDSHLPYLIGNVSLLPFESLPKGDQSEWVVDSGVAITEENGNDRGGFGPRFGPFSNQENKNVQAATEVTRYKIESQKDNLVTVRKSYQLTSPGSGEESFDINGAATWVFDKTDNIPHSLDSNSKLIVREGNSSTTFPISMKITRISAEELAKMEADAKRAMEEAQRMAAETKAKAEAPLTREEKQSSIASLKSSDNSDMLKSLAMLESKSPKTPDAEIAAAITPLLKHSDKEVVEAAQKALLKWSPEFKRKHDLNKAYDGPGAMGSSDLEVESSTPLYVGQRIQFQEHGSFWFAGRIKELLPNNKVRIDVLAWGKANRELTLSRRNLQLAPPEVDQPSRPTKELAVNSDEPATATSTVMRTWTDKSGRFRIEASFVSEEQGTVKLLRKDGKEARIPIDKLSEGDQAFIHQMLDENPFEVKK